MELSKRLASIAAMVDEKSRLADIGTDHGYLPIWLVEEGIVPSAIAMDINEGPLFRAKTHVKEHGLEEKIVLRRSDGLEALLPGEADTAVIAGMGGLLTIRILENGRRTALSLKSLVLSPQSELREVRRYLLKNGFFIDAEDMILDEGKYYTVMKVLPGAEAVCREEEPWTYIEEKYGRYLLRSGNPVVCAYLNKEQNILETIWEQLKRAESGKAKDRFIQVEEELASVKAAIKIWETCAGM